jgi:hypothetical protein
MISSLKVLVPIGYKVLKVAVVLLPHVLAIAQAIKDKPKPRKYK